MRSVQAAAAPTPGIGLSPAVQDRVLGPKDTSASFKVQLANQTDQPRSFTLSSRDFTSLNQIGGLAFLPADTSRTTKGHGLSGNVAFDQPRVTIAAHGSQMVTATVNDVSALAPGGHYAAIVAQVVPAKTNSAGNNVAINQAVSSLIFLETAGKGSKGLTLLEPPLDKLTASLPATVNVVFKATGNTQTVPRGLVTIERAGKTYRQGVINENSSLLLPGSTRLLPTQLQGNRHPFWPGRYILRVQYRYEGSLGVSDYQKTFFYVNIPALIAVLAAVTIALLVALRLRNYWKLHGRPAWLQRKPMNSTIISPGDTDRKKGRIMDVTRPKK